MELRNKKIIHTEKRRLSNYYTVIDDSIYCNTWPKEHKTYCNKKGKETIVIKRSGASHNFTPFNFENKLYAIGGMDAWKFEKQWRDIDKFEDFLFAFKKRFYRDYSKGVDSFKVFRERMLKLDHLNHVDGLYLFINRDGKWDQLSKKPIITIHSKGFKELHGKSTEFDGQPSIVYHNGLYYIYLRYNVKYKTRYIQYATSTDLYDWFEFNTINIDGYDFDLQNYYTPNFYSYNGYIIGMIAFFEEDISCIRLLKSENGIDFEITGEIFKDSVAMLTSIAPKNKIVPAIGLEYDDKNVSIYMHHNYLGIDKENPVEIIKYTIDKKDFERAFNI